MMKRALIVVAKQPVAGQVKTRIAVRLGQERAAQLYCCSLEDTLDLVSSFGEAQPILSYTPATEASRSFFANLAPEFLLLSQHGTDLGERLLDAFRQSAMRGSDRMVILGTDSPSLPLQFIAAAFSALDDPATDVVMGPATDGGYYLLGLRTPYPELFAGISWSTERVAAQTRARAAAAGLRLVELDPWYDLDTVDDLRHLVDDLRRQPDGRARRTHAFVSGIFSTEGAST